MSLIIRLPTLASNHDFVFINCPFDENYLPIFQAIVYTVYRCGFTPKCALEEDNGLQNRLEKIEKCIGDCRYGIHDLSRIELSANNLPRFNMPFELGIFFGAKRFGDREQKNKNALIFDTERYRYQQFISDLNGVDIKAHKNDPSIVIKSIRNWLVAASKRTTIPGEKIIIKEFQTFIKKLPVIASDAGIDENDIPFNDLCAIVEEVVNINLQKIKLS